MIALVMVLFLLGMLMLYGINALFLDVKKSLISERNYFNHYNQASSSLAWALQQHWLIPTKDWQCQKSGIYQISACVKRSIHADFVLIKGGSESLYLYWLALFDPATNLLTAVKGNWLDFCPEKTNEYCE